MAQNCRAPVIVRSSPISSASAWPCGCRAQVVVPAGRAGGGPAHSAFHQRPGAGGGLGSPDEGGAEQRTCAASAVGSAASRPWLIASLTSCPIRVSASAAAWPAAPLAAPGRRVGDGLQLTLSVGTAHW